jgi:photosystem II stability/assembly factor-like uncharacterized protein
MSMRARLLAGIAFVALATFGAPSNAASSASPLPAKPSPYDPVSTYLDITPSRSGDLSHPYVKGKVVAVSKENHTQYPDTIPPRTIDRSLALYPELVPKHPQDVGTIVWEDCAAETAGQYTNGAQAYDVNCVVSVIDKAANLIVGQKSFTAAAPVAVPSEASYGMSEAPTREIAAYVANLPRLTLAGKPIPRTKNATAGGRSWSEQKTVPGVEQVWFSAVAFGDASHGWTVGNEPGGNPPTILATADAGATWNAQSLGTENHWMTGVAFADPTHGWVVGGDGTILATADGGAHWTAQSSGTTTAFLRAVTFVDASHGCVVGEEEDSITPGVNHPTILTTTDGGAIWTAQTLSINEELYGVAFSDADHGWAVGGRGATGDSNVILATNDGGVTWRKQTVGHGPPLAAVAFSDNKHGWAVGGHTNAEKDSNIILVTKDGGAHWKRQKARSSAPFGGVTFVDNKHGWVVGDDGTILATTDGGAHWKVQKSRTTSTLHAVTFVDATNGWTVGDGAIVATTNGGASRPNTAK